MSDDQQIQYLNSELDKAHNIIDSDYRTEPLLAHQVRLDKEKIATLKKVSKQSRTAVIMGIRKRVHFFWIYKLFDYVIIDKLEIKGLRAQI